MEKTRILAWVLACILLARCGGGELPDTTLLGGETDPTEGIGKTGNPGTGEEGQIVKKKDPGGDDGGSIPTPAELTISPATFDFGLRSVNSYSHLTFTITNIGERYAEGMAGMTLSAPYSFRGGSYPGSGATCGNNLAPAATCTVVVTYHPTAAGRYQLNAPLVTHTIGSVGIDLDARGSNIATLEIDNLMNDDDFTDFGLIPHSTTLDRTFRIKYYGAKPATGVSFSGLIAPFSIVNNTCGNAVSADCDITVRYTGISAGNSQRKLKVTYHNSAYAAEDEHTMLGETSPEDTAATLSISSGNYGYRLLNVAHDRTYTVYKGGTRPATAVTGANFANSQFTFKGGSFPGTGGSCGTTITSNCTIVVTFTPTALVTYNDTISLNYHNGFTANQSANRAINGRGANPASLTLTANDGTPDFGLIAAGHYREEYFTLTNDPDSVSASAVALWPLTDFFSYRTTCSGSIAPGASCTFRVRFSPADAIAYADTIRAHYFDGANNQFANLAISGTGDDGALLHFNNSSYSFGNVVVGNSVTAYITIRHYGILGASNFVVTGMGGAFTFPGGNYPGGGTCGATSITADCTVGVTFTPPAEQYYSTTLQIQYDSGDGQTRTTQINLSGNGIILDAASLSFDDAPSYNWGSYAVNSSVTRTFVVRRTGDLTATGISASGLSGDINFLGGSYPGSGGTCGVNLSSSTCTIRVTFNPTDAVTTNHTLTLNYNDGFANQSTSINLSGTGYHAAVLNMTAVNLGEVEVSAPDPTAQGTITVSNTGTRSATSMVFGSLSAPFSVIGNTCAATLNDGASCTVTVQMTITEPGQWSQNLSLNYHNGVSNAVRSANVAGAGTVPILVDVNGNHTCARGKYGALKCWGHNRYGQLGLGNTTDRGDSSAGGHQMGSSLPVVDVGSGRYATALALGHWHTCVILDDGNVKCWGLNDAGQLGSGTNAAALGDEGGEMGNNLSNVDLGTGRTAVSIAAGYAHTCAVLDDGTLKCWGDNDEGQLGLEDTTDRGLNIADMGDSLNAVDLGGLSVSQVAANAGHTCARLSNNSVKCWGNNFYGQLGVGDYDNHGDDPNEMGANLPVVDLGTGVTAKSISTGGAFTCVVTNSDTVKCWGRNESGILGRLWCQDTQGALGHCTDPGFTLPVLGYGSVATDMGDNLPTVSLGSTVKAVQSGNSSSCAVLADDTLKCWGDNQYGQLGLGDTTDRGTDTAQMGANLATVSLGSGLTVKQLAGGYVHGCALLSNDSIKCWGHNRYGGLGYQDTNNRGDSAGEMGNSLPAVSY